MTSTLSGRSRTMTLSSSTWLVVALALCIALLSINCQAARIHLGRGDGAQSQAASASPNSANDAAVQEELSWYDFGVGDKSKLSKAFAASIFDAGALAASFVEVRNQPWYDESSSQASTFRDNHAVLVHQYTAQYDATKAGQDAAPQKAKETVNEITELTEDPFHNTKKPDVEKPMQALPTGPLSPNDIVPILDIANVDVSSIKRMCPSKSCGNDTSCRFGETGVCCGNGACCPKGATCLNTHPPTCVYDQDTDPDRCPIEECANSHHCPNAGVKFCCSGATMCCKYRFRCDVSTGTTLCVQAANFSNSPVEAARVPQKPEKKLGPNALSSRHINMSAILADISKDLASMKSEGLLSKAAAQTSLTNSVKQFVMSQRNVRDATRNAKEYAGAKSCPKRCLAAMKKRVEKALAKKQRQVAKLAKSNAAAIRKAKKKRKARRKRRIKRMSPLERIGNSIFSVARKAIHKAKKWKQKHMDKLNNVVKKAQEAQARTAAQIQKTLTGNRGIFDRSAAAKRLVGVLGAWAKMRSRPGETGPPAPMRPKRPPSKGSTALWRRFLPEIREQGYHRGLTAHDVLRKYASLTFHWGDTAKPTNAVQ
jgi:hypothetical protein